MTGILGNHRDPAITGAIHVQKPPSAYSNLWGPFVARGKLVVTRTFDRHWLRGGGEWSQGPWWSQGFLSDGPVEDAQGGYVAMPQSPARGCFWSTGHFLAPKEAVVVPGSVILVLKGTFLLQKCPFRSMTGAFRDPGPIGHREDSLWAPEMFWAKKAIWGKKQKIHELFSRVTSQLQETLLSSRWPP